jgi:hypothetical protein
MSVSVYDMGISTTTMPKRGVWDRQFGMQEFLLNIKAMVSNKSGRCEHVRCNMGISTTTTPSMECGTVSLERMNSSQLYSS